MSSGLVGAGLGLRRELISNLLSYTGDEINFLELAPENWLAAGGRYERDLRQLSERYRLTCHGLSLSLGSADPLDFHLLKQIKRFMREHQVSLYTEHLSWCSYNGHLYDLLPIPYNEETLTWLADRIRQAQDALEMPIGLENASYYFTPPGATMAEAEFISALIKDTGCYLHLDVNNIYVNSLNLGFDADEYLRALPLHKVGYIHVAGHLNTDDGVVIDTHGADVIDPVWHLLQRALQLIDTDAMAIPTCLERDFNFPDFSCLLSELRTIKSLQRLNRQPTQLTL